MTRTIAAARLLTGTADHAPGWVVLDGGSVTALGGGEPPRAPDVLLPSGVLAPGLVDVQVNGGFGVDLATADDEGWALLARRLPATGVTSFVPTLISAPVDVLAEALRAFGSRCRAADGSVASARILGVHLEGPFLAEGRRGAHRREYLRDPAPEAVAALVAAAAGAGAQHPRGAGGVLRYLTLAPERAGALDAITTLVAAGIRVAVGHSDATEAQVRAAADAGASLVTHLFNAQRPLHHREPGVVGAALDDDRLTCGLIVDGHHVAPAAVRIAFACAPGRIMLVSDAVAALGMPPGAYLLGGERVVVREGGPARRADGTIAGGCGRLDDAVALAVAAGVPLRAAVEAATVVPAAAVGRPDLGRLAPGGPADLVWLGPDASQRVRARAGWVAGALAHADPGLEAVLGTPAPTSPRDART